MSVPLVGTLAAGRSNIEYLPIVRFRQTRQPAWARPHDRFVLAEINGDSLTGAGIFDGDFVLIHLTHDIKSGDLCAVNTPCGMLIKYVYARESELGVALQSANPDYPPLFFDLTDVEIQGRVIRVERDID